MSCLASDNGSGTLWMHSRKRSVTKHFLIITFVIVTFIYNNNNNITFFEHYNNLYMTSSFFWAVTQLNYSVKLDVSGEFVNPIFMLYKEWCQSAIFGVYIYYICYTVCIYIYTHTYRTNTQAITSGIIRDSLTWGENPQAIPKRRVLTQQLRCVTPQKTSVSPQRKP